MVRHQGRVIWRGHLGGKKSRLGSMGEGPCQGENLGSDGSLVKDLLGVTSGSGWWRQQFSCGCGWGITGWEHGALGVRMWLGWGLGVVSWGRP